MTLDPVRWAVAAAVVLVWLTISLWFWRRNRRPVADGSTGGDLIAFASQTGFGETLAAMTATAFAQAGRPARVVSFADLTTADLRAADRVLFIASTTGEGDAPDSAARFVRTVMTPDADLAGLRYGLMSLGDHSYKHVCGFGRALDAWLSTTGATPLFDTIEVDNGDAVALQRWQSEIAAITGVAANWTEPAHAPWRLIERIHLNPGSPSEPAFHLALEPVGDLGAWSAGDIAEIEIPNPASGVTLRDYSVASLPSDGRLELLIRRMHRPDGTPGLASGWLTGALTLGAAANLRVRPNSAFHGPADTTPMILIGNGTGLAGLRSHLKARSPASAGAWLMFGERTAAHDAFHDAELQAWLADGTLTRLDRTFSRDPGDGRYVQAVVTAQADAVRDWVQRGAAIYVCGSQVGMAEGVDQALRGVLGEDAVRDLTEAGRYRRDVY